MADHAELSPTEAADHLAIRELFDACVHRADGRRAERQKDRRRPCLGPREGAQRCSPSTRALLGS